MSTWFLSLTRVWWAGACLAVAPVDLPGHGAATVLSRNDGFVPASRNVRFVPLMRQAGFPSNATHAT